MKNNLLFLSCMGMSLCILSAKASDRRHEVAEALSFKGLGLRHTLLLQTITITGTVRDGAGGLPGVTIRVKGKQTVSLTDTQGKYSITAEAGDVLVFSYVGYKEQSVTVTAGNAIDVVLEEDATSLQEVTVNAGYYKVKDKERTGSIVKISSKDIETQPVNNVLATMQGRMAGVNIIQETGTAGGGFSVQIRGINSLQADGNAPLYIIDGVPYSSDPIGNGVSMSIMPQRTSPLANINPGDVESIEVLKDADATAIYGSRGANGVVLVTTKKGVKGKTRFNGSVSQGFGQVSHFMKMMNTQQYLSMRAEAFANDGITEYPETAYDINGTWDATRSTNWQKEFLGGTAKITNASASVSGGSEQTQFLLSSNYGEETTIFNGDFGYKKTNVHVNLNHTSEDQRFRASFSGSYTLQKNRQPSADLTIDAWILAPNAPALYTESGELNWEENTFENPLAKLNGHSRSETYDLVANSVLSYSLLKNLKISTSLGYTHLSHDESSTFPNTIYNPAYEVGTEASVLYTTDTGRRSWIVEPQLHWTSKIGLVATDLLVGGTFQHQENNSVSLSGTGFTSNSLIYNPAAAIDQRVMGFDASEYKYQSFFGRANFNVDGKYILNLTGRRDGSSRFGADHRFGWFGAVGAAWLFTKEKALADNEVLSFGKLRTSYGTTGSDQIGNYKFLNTYMPTTTTYEGIIGLQPSRLYNAAFRWETNRKFEAALELGFLKDRILLTSAYYRNISSNQLVGVPLPATTGFTEIQSNLNATVLNSGVEFTLRTVNFNSTDFEWTTDFNFSMAKNELLSFPNLEASTFSRRYVIGQPLNITKVYRYTGIDPETGIYTFEDVNGDGQLTDADDRTYVADLNPTYFGGLQNHLRYQNWQLDFLFQFVKQKNYNVPSLLGVAGTANNMPTMMLDHWQQPGDTGPGQIYTTGENGEAVEAMYRYAASDGAISDASYIRLKNVSLRYEFPKRWTGNIQCRATLEGQNLLTITPYKGTDPEFTGYGYIPPLRIVTAGLQFNF